MMNSPHTIEKLGLSVHQDHPHRSVPLLAEARHGLRRSILTDAANSHLLGGTVIQFCQGLSTYLTHSRLPVGWFFLPWHHDLSNAGKHRVLLMNDFDSGCAEAVVVNCIFYAKGGHGSDKKGLLVCSIDRKRSGDGTLTFRQNCNEAFSEPIRGVCQPFLPEREVPPLAFSLPFRCPLYASPFPSASRRVRP